MAKRQQYKRLLLLALLLGAAFVGLGYRLVDLQVVRHEELLAKAREITQRRFIIEPRRGDIRDVRGNLLATSVFVKTVCADPVLIGNRQADVVRAIAPLLQLNEAEIYERLLPRLRRNQNGETITNRYVVLKRKVPPETWERVQAAMKNLNLGLDETKLTSSQEVFVRNLRQSAVFTDPMDDQLRFYPNGAFAAHVLGFVGMQDREFNGSRRIETVGVEGIERTMNSKLTGARGWLLTERDGKRREVVTFREQDVEPRNGLNVVLTLDSVVQSVLQTALADAMQKHSPASISGIVVRPRTGDILAMATLPDFDPNQPGASPADARRNRAITDIMEPGSTFKIVVVSGALNDGSVRLNDVFHCENGRFAFGGRVLHDHHPYGPLSVETIITKSSNIGAAKVGIRLGENRLLEYIREFGFGARTGIALPGEVAGIVHPVKDWSKVSIAQIPMGHGIAVTRLQMAMAMCAIANDGWLMQPRIVDRLEDSAGNVITRFPPQRTRQVINETAARQMVETLKTVVSSEGTAPGAAMENYIVGGKTGTAQKPGPGGYMPGKYIASFIGFFPADSPELCISIVMDEPKKGYYGGVVAAPVFKQVAEHAANYLNIRPDLIAAPQDKPEPMAAAGRRAWAPATPSAN